MWNYNYTSELKHHGILGMKWGVRRTPQQLGRSTASRFHKIKNATPEQLGKARGVVDSSSGIVREANNLSSSISAIRSSTKNVETKHMTDQELREKVSRMNLEQQYSQLVKNDVSRGEVYLKNALAIGGGALAITSSSLGIALAIKQLKK